MENLVLNATDKLEKYIAKEDYKGYDPYDTLNSTVPLQKLGKWIPILATQFQKRNPFNIRSLLGIEKEVNPKTLGLLLNAFVKQYHLTKDGKFLKESEELLSLLIHLRSKGYKNYCWGYNFPWASPLKKVPAYHPSVVATAFIVKGLYQYYLLTEKEGIKEIILSAAQYVIENLPRIERETGICISYTDIQMDACHNANLLGAEILSYAYVLSGDENLKNLAVKALAFTVSHQKEDGRWNYSIDFETDEERKQIDFHQGYVIESANRIVENCDLEDKYDKYLKKGLEYFRQEQFYDNGRSLWRVPRKWPVEIHNQSQGIITFIKNERFDEEYVKFAHKIADWTINNMQDPEGYFYYQKHQFYTIKIPYMRWSQAWMYLALTDLQYHSQ